MPGGQSRIWRWLAIAAGVFLIYVSISAALFGVQRYTELLPSVFRTSASTRLKSILVAMCVLWMLWSVAIGVAGYAVLRKRRRLGLIAGLIVVAIMPGQWALKAAEERERTAWTQTLKAIGDAMKKWEAEHPLETPKAVKP